MTRNLFALNHLISALLTDDSGQDLIEYALVAAIVGLGAVLSMKSLSSAINSSFATISSSLTSNV